MELAWKDAQVVLFMSTVGDGKLIKYSRSTPWHLRHTSPVSDSTTRLRRRPAGTSSVALQTRKMFGDNARAWLEIPTLIDLYNHYMKGVDTADQLRSYYVTHRRFRKTWRPLFNFLLTTITTNCFKLSSFAHPGWPHKAGHKAFLEKLVHRLFESSIRLTTRSLPPSIIWKPAVEHGYKPVKISSKLLTCWECKQAGKTTLIERKSRRKPLAELSNCSVLKSSNSNERVRRKQAPRTRFGCQLCQIPLCRAGDCWGLHIDRLNTKE